MSIRSSKVSLPALAGLVLAAVAGPANAHVILETKEAAIGSRVQAVFVVPHGCGESDTIKLRVRIPEGVIAAVPETKAGWTIETKTGVYAAAYEDEGRKVSEGVQEIVWSGGRVPAKTREPFLVGMTLTTALKPDSTLYFPVVQECEADVRRWIEIPAEGTDPHSYKQPAPGIRLLPKP
ncbi:YcnI family protein [Bradyrhizobium sp. HKCCYLS2038]|uniref:YcnI family copper-binding membrane protein n=1 Tax=unclassified Bradyrhizobium TaxID=2631580 RepID=UPI003EB967B8